MSPTQFLSLFTTHQMSIIGFVVVLVFVLSLAWFKFDTSAVSMADAGPDRAWVINLPTMILMFFGVAFTFMALHFTQMHDPFSYYFSWVIAVIASMFIVSASALLSHDILLVTLNKLPANGVCYALSCMLAIGLTTLGVVSAGYEKINAASSVAG